MLGLGRCWVRIGRHENKEKRFFYFCLRILLQIQIHLLEIENPKIGSPYSGCLSCTRISRETVSLKILWEFQEETIVDTVQSKGSIEYP
jgi:hypothetical protein